ncbi:MAG TPA: hypothetical protein VE907_15815 [Gammaproteobacteria bacterium]|nr:hypothetical protein [Gammaproteobacteria bacterium]
MSPFVAGMLVLVVSFGGALAGMQLRRSLPPHHLDESSGNTVKVAIGLIATMTALVLGLITGSAKSSFDETSKAIERGAAELISLDRALVRYGPETAEVRKALRSALAARIDAAWPQGNGPPRLEVEDVRRAENIVAAIHALEPTNEEQRWLRSRSADLGEAVLDARWLTANAGSASMLGPFLTALLFWLAMTFTSFGLFAPRNGTVLGALLVCAVSVASAVFLVLEMDGPFTGLVKVSPEPLRYALTQMDRGPEI